MVAKKENGQSFSFRWSIQKSLKKTRERLNGHLNGHLAKLSNSHTGQQLPSVHFIPSTHTQSSFAL